MKNKRIEIENRLIGKITYIQSILREKSDNLSKKDIALMQGTLEEAYGDLENYKKLKPTVKYKFIVIEGLKGSGKTTHSKLLVEKLSSIGIETVNISNISSDELITYISNKQTNNNGILKNSISDLGIWISELYSLSDKIKQFISKDVVVVCDGWLGSVLTRMCESKEHLIAGKTLCSELITPDVVLYLGPNKTLTNKDKLLEEKMNLCHSGFKKINITHNNYEDINSVADRIFDVCVKKS